MAAPQAEDPTAGIAAPSADGSLAMTLLPTVLSLIAGSVDVISFLGLGGLFAAHITGNLALLTAHVVSGHPAPLAMLLSVPVFMAMVGLTRLLAGCLEAIGIATLQPLLLLQFLLLTGFLALCVAAGPRIDPSAARTVLAGMLGVAAMAVQNALVQISLKDAPPTAVMTSNVTRFMMDVGELMLGRGFAGATKTRDRVKQTGRAIVGFAAGCGLGAACQVAFGFWSLALPAGLALLAMAMALHPSAARGHWLVPIVSKRTASRPTRP